MFAVYKNGIRISEWFECKTKAYEKLRIIYDGLNLEECNAILGYNSLAMLRDGKLYLYEIDER